MLLNPVSQFPHSVFSVTPRLFLSELPHLHDSFVDNLLELKPRLSVCKPVELVKILQTTLRQSSLLQLTVPEQVYQIKMPVKCATRENLHYICFGTKA